MRQVPGIVVAGLTAAEAAGLERLEKAIEAGQANCFEIGRALKLIRDRRLYRQQARTFADYLEKRWDMSESRGYQLIEAAEVVVNLNNCGTKPANEAQARPLCALEPADQKKAWKLAVDTTRGRITAAHVTQCVEQILGRPVDAVPGETSPEAQAAFAALPPEAKAAVLERQREEAKAAENRSKRPTRQVGGEDADERSQAVRRHLETARKLQAGRGYDPDHVVMAIEQALTALDQQE